MLCLLLLGFLPGLVCFVLAIRMQPINGDLTRIGAYPESQYGWSTPQRVFAQPLFGNSVADQADVLVIGDSFATAMSNHQWQNQVVVATGMSVSTVSSYDLTVDQAILATLGATAVHAVDRAQLQAGEQILVVGMGLVVTATVSIYITFTYLVTYATVTLKLPMRDAFMVQMAGAALMVVIMPFFGALSDRVGRRMLTIGSLIGYLVVLYPLYAWLTDGPTVQKLLITQLVVCVFVAVFFGVFSTVMAELFPPQVRSAGMSMAYNVAVMIFGGFAQFIVTWLIRSTGSPMAPAFYVMFGVTLGLLAAFFIKDRAMERNLR